MNVVWGVAIWCPRICTGEKDGVSGESTIGVVVGVIFVFVDDGGDWPE